MLTVCCNLCSAQASSTIPPLECSSGSGTNSLCLDNLCGPTGFVKSSPGGSKVPESVLESPFNCICFTLSASFQLSSAHFANRVALAQSSLWYVSSPNNFIKLINFVCISDASSSSALEIGMGDDDWEWVGSDPRVELLATPFPNGNDMNVYFRTDDDDQEV